jgi:Cellulase (glycosyl hydrolase family 5)
MKRNSIIRPLALWVLLMAGCVSNLPQAEIPTNPIPTVAAAPQSSPGVSISTPTLSPLPTLPPAATLPARSVPPPSVPPAPHRLGVRIVNGTGEFYDRVTNDKFIARGNNYIRLGAQTTSSGGSQIYHSLFDPGRYDTNRVSTDFKRMHADGYNVVRVFLSQNTIASASGGLSVDYLRNMADLLTQARANDLYVIFTLDWLPGGRYGDILNGDCCDLFNFMNIHFLSRSGLEANRAFFQDLVQGLVSAGAPMDPIMAYELRNELYFDADQPPLSLSKGMILAANGRSYDMSNPQDKKKMIDENLVYWIDYVRTAILQVDPTALVTVGFFQPQQPNPTRAGDPRLVSTYPAIWQSQADFVDLHAYPGGDLDLKQLVENFGMAGFKAKPIIMGEFGAGEDSFASLDAAAKALMAWQVESCRYGFDGWLLWTWDLDNGEFYPAVQDNGIIERVLAPGGRPDPCSTRTFGFLENNIALGKHVRVSRALADQPGSNVVDGTDAQWGSGSHPPQWIEIDLGKPSAIRLIRLQIAQYPDGETVHRLWGKGASGEYRLLHEFHGVTRDNQVLEFAPPAPLQAIRYVKVETVSGPSWVSWKEIQIIAP